ncbi:hypothetical protein [Dorea formicigenerans]|uniref:Uncharacterized protein n=1 Tax=Dorea formicigenerans TaxID=39486 RepID=A0A3E5EH16_9FIRM|nr:hypothetical protein [Dorea formicigenerans]RGN88013.1 hypothetical protein DXB36_14505 [Dorea formicigenerans]
MMDSLLLYKILKNRTGAEISASGNPAIMSDTLKNNPMNEMKVFGWSKQERTTGAQLFPTITPSTEVKNGITVEYMEHGKIHISGTSEKTVDFMTPTFELLAGTYTLSMGINIDNTLMRCTLSTAEGLPYFDILNNEASKTETTEDNMILYLLLRVYGGKTIDITIQPMLNMGTSPLPWEPYTGGQPSPSPDYPQQIVSAGDGGEVEVTICGKNLFDGNTDISKTQYYKLPIQMKKGAKLTMSFIGVGTGTGPAKAYCHDSRGVYCGTLFYFDIKSGVNKYSSTIICMGGEERIYFYNTGFSQFFENMYDIQIEINGIATDYKPYYTPQSLSISTPTGLPAIPVDTDGNYTDADGQQWIADYVDFKRGKYVQNVTAFELTGDEKFRYESSSNTQNISDGLYTVGFPMNDTINKMVISNAFVQATNNWTPEIIYVKEKKVSVFTLTNAHWIFFVLDATTFPTKEDFVLFLKAKKDAGNPVVLYYNLSEPIERNLTQSEIQAYQNLVTYAGTTIVENDAECYMEVSAGGGDSLRAKKLALILGD